MWSGRGRPFQQLHCAEGRALLAIFVLDSTATAGLAQMFAQKLPGVRVERENMQVIHWTRTSRPIQPGDGAYTDGGPRCSISVVPA